MISSAKAASLFCGLLLAAALWGPPASGAERGRRGAIVTTQPILAGISVERTDIRLSRLAVTARGPNDFLDSISEVVGGLSLVDVPANRAIGIELFWRPLPDMVDVGILRVSAGLDSRRPTSQCCGPNDLDDWLQYKALLDRRVGRRLSLCVSPMDWGGGEITVIGILLKVNDDPGYVEMALRRSAVVKLARWWGVSDYRLGIARADGAYGATLYLGKPDECSTYPDAQRESMEYRRCDVLEGLLSPQKFMKYFFAVPWFGCVATFPRSDFKFDLH